MPKPKAHPKPVNNRRYLQFCRQLLASTALMTDFVSPPWTLEEEARAKFLASAWLAAVEASDGARVRALADTIAFRMGVAGVIEYMEREVGRKAAPAPLPEPEPVVAALSPEASRVAMEAAGYKFEDKAQNEGEKS